MKKILIVNDGFPPHVWGGASTIAQLHGNGLAQRGWEVNTHVPSTMGVFAKELKSFNPDVVHFHNINKHFFYRSIAIAKKGGAKVFLTAHDVMSFAYEKIDRPRRISWWENFISAKRRFNPLRNVIIRYYLKKLDKVVAVSHALRDALTQNGIKNVAVVHNGIDAEAFQKSFDENSFRESLGLGSAPIVLFMGRLTPPKGSEVLFKSMSVVTQTLPDAKLLAVGTPIDEWMKNTLQRFKISDSVMILPAVPYEDVYKYYRIADVVVVPSIYLDPFPTVNLEAMAAKKPVVATCFGGSPEVVEDGKTGYIVDPSDTNELTGKIIVLLQDEEKAEAFGRAGNERVAHEFSLERFIDAYEKLY